MVSKHERKAPWRNDMALYAVDVRDRVIRRVTQEYNGVDNKRFF